MEQSDECCCELGKAKGDKEIHLNSISVDEEDLQSDLSMLLTPLYTVPSCRAGTVQTVQLKRARSLCLVSLFQALTSL